MLLKKIKFDEKEVDLSIEIEKLSSDRYKFSVPLPDSLKLILPKLKIIEILGDLEISFEQIEPHNFYINFFYIYVSKNMLEETVQKELGFNHDESELLKKLQDQMCGIGKDILCFSFSYFENIILKKNIDNENVKLQAEDNVKLREYYGKYGFVLDKDMVYMNSTVSKIKEYCAEKYKCKFKKSGAKKIVAKKSGAKKSVTKKSVAKKSVKKSVTKKLHNKWILFSGFRNNKLESKINTLKGIVITYFSKRVFMVVTKDKNFSSEKIKKAKEEGIPVVTIEQFCKMFKIDFKKLIKKSN